MNKLKLVIQSALMAVGIAVILGGLPTDGATLFVGGALFGAGLHWYRKGLGFTMVFTSVLLGCLAPVAAGAVAQKEPLLGLIAFLIVGGVYHLIKVKK